MRASTFAAALCIVSGLAHAHQADALVADRIWTGTIITTTDGEMRAHAVA